jgi:hypothetical protein
MDAVARVKPAKDKIEERVRGCLARAHRIQLKTITATQGLNTIRVATIALAGVSTERSPVSTSAYFESVGTCVPIMCSKISSPICD